MCSGRSFHCRVCFRVCVVLTIVNTWPFFLRPLVLAVKSFIYCLLFFIFITHDTFRRLLKRGHRVANTYIIMMIYTFALHAHTHTPKYSKKHHLLVGKNKYEKCLDKTCVWRVVIFLNVFNYCYEMKICF